MTTLVAEPVQNDRVDPMVWKIAGVAILGPFMTSLDMTVVNVSLAGLSHELHTTLSTIQWVTSAYLLSLALMLPLSGWLVDRIGAKRVYLYCFSLFTLTSLLCGIADSVGHLIVYRVLQGVAGGLLAPMAQMMMARVAGRHVARVMGYSVVPIMLGPILGPSLAGALLQHGSWRWIFLINLPVGILSTFLAWRILPRDENETNPRSFDLLGFLLLSPALVMLLHSLDRLGSGETGAAVYKVELAVSIALIFAFIRHARLRGKRAIIDISLFRGRTFSAAASTQFLSNCMLIGGQMLTPLYLLMVEGKTPGATGILLAPMGVGMLISYPMMGTLTERFGPRRVSTAGALIALFGTIPFALFATHKLPVAALCLALFIRGIGTACINIPSIAAAYSSLPKETIPIATTAINIVQRLGGPIATTFLAVYLHHSMQIRKMDIPHAFAATFCALCAIHAICVLAASRLPLRTAHRDDAARADMPLRLESSME